MTNIAILGCGHIAKKMANTLRLMVQAGDDVCLYAAAARDLERAKTFAQEEGFLHAYGSYEDMLRDENVDLVYIATPHSHHAEQMKLCIAHGKAILCEKSFTRNAQEAREVLALAKEKGVLVAEAIWTRYMPSRQIIADIIAAGTLGNVQYVTGNLHYYSEEKERIYKPELAGGALLDIGVYPLNFAAMFLGTDFERMETDVQLMETGVDRQEHFSLFYPNGCVAQLSSGVATRSNREGMICGTKGYLTVDNVNDPTRVTMWLAEDNYEVAHDVPLPKQLTGYEYQVRSCMKALKEGALECPEMPHAETIRIMEIMDELRQRWGVTYPGESGV